ncbi:uncharacterized protein METZ01_LOCUS511805, partial [marine metagenome]
VLGSGFAEVETAREINVFYMKLLDTNH